MIPFARYVIAGWSAKRKDIMDGFNAEARLEYFKMFCYSNPIPTLKNAPAEFMKVHAKSCGGSGIMHQIFWSCKAPGVT